jgi:hypothetical protein
MNATEQDSAITEQERKGSNGVFKITESRISFNNGNFLKDWMRSCQIPVILLPKKI